MDVVLDRMFEGLKMSLSRELSQYIVKVSQVKKSFYVLVRKSRGEILGCKKEKLFDVAENISENIYYNYCRDCTELGYNFFPYFTLVRNFGNYHFHFLVLRQEYTVWMYLLMEVLFLALR